MKLVILLVIMCFCGCNSHRGDVIQDKNAFYDIHTKEFLYAIDNKGYRWEKDTLLVAGVGPLKSMVVPPELKEIKIRLQQERDAVKK